VPADPILPLVGLAERVSPYGPLFTVITLPLAWLELPTALWVLKAGHGLVALASLALVWSSARRLGRDPLAPVLFIALNPLWLVWAVGGAHNDVITVVLVLAAIRLGLARRGPIGAGAALGAATAVKLSAGLALPFLLVGTAARGRALTGAMAVTTAVGGLSVLVLEPGVLGFAGTAVDHAGFVSLYSLPSALARLTGLDGVGAGLRAVLTVSLLAAIALAVRSVLRGGDWPTAAGWATLALVATSTWLYPWYVIWVLPFAALGASVRLRRATVMLTALVIAVRLPEGLTSVF
jgi:alpha-1,6-mannosyltransferase